MSDVEETEIITPHDNDVLSGRGNSINSHPGNKRFRNFVNAQRENYADTSKNEKPIFAKLIVNMVRNLVPPGRFLERDNKTKLWHDTGDRKAWDKTRQALREKPSKITDRVSLPVSGSKVTEPTVDSLPFSAKSESSTHQLRLMLTRQLDVAATNQSVDPWLSEHVVSDEKDMIIPIGRESIIHDQFGRAFPLRGSFTQKKQKKRDSKHTFNESIGTFSDTGLSGFSEPTNISNDTGISFATMSTASCSSGVEPVSANTSESQEAHAVNTDALNNSLYLEGMVPPNLGEEVSGSTDINRDDYGSTQMMAKEDLSMSSSAFMSEKRPSILKKNKQISGLSRLSMTSSTIAKEDLSIATSAFMSEKRPSILKTKQISDSDPSCASTNLSIASSTLASEKKQSLLRESFSTFVPDIGEGNENDLTYEEGDASKNYDMSSLQTDEMSTQSRRRSSLLSRRNSIQSNLDDLSGLTGRMSICESMSMEDSGILSMSAEQVKDWVEEAARWEKEAELEDSQVMQEELLQLEHNSEEVNNMTEMSAMMSDAFFVSEHEKGRSAP